MSKKYKDKPCAYCGRPNSSSTGDHIFARSFSDEQYRNNLPKVPSCSECNNNKSKLEHYLATMLPFGSRIGNSDETWRNLSDKLEINQRFKSHISVGFNKKSTPNNGLYVQEIEIPFDGDIYT